MNRDRPERRVVVVAQVLLLPLGAATTDRRRSGSSTRASACSRTGPASTCWRTTSGRSPGVGATVIGSPGGSVMIDWRSRKVCSSSSCSRPTSTARPGAGCCGLRPRPGLRADRRRSCRPASALERLLRRLQLARRDREQPIDRQRDALRRAAPSARTCRGPSRNERARLRRELGLEVLDVGADRLRRFGLRVGEIAEQVQVVDARRRRAADRRR